MLMSHYSNRSKYTTAMVQRDLNPHKAARFAMWFWSERYAAQRLGSMGFWDNLNEQQRATARRAVSEILAAPNEDA